MARWLSVAVVAGTLIVPATAAAASPPPPLTLERIIQMADTRWGSPCDGRVSLSFSDLSPGDVGISWPDECRVEITRALLGRKVSLCLIVMHEWGHLAGRDHSNDPRSIMNPVPSMVYAIRSAPECVPRHLRRIYVQMERDFGLLRPPTAIPRVSRASRIRDCRSGGESSLV